MDKSKTKGKVLDYPNLSVITLISIQKEKLKWKQKAKYTKIIGGGTPTRKEKGFKKQKGIKTKNRNKQINQ